MTPTTTAPSNPLPRLQRPVEGEFVTAETVDGDKAFRVALATYELARHRLDQIEQIAADETLSDEGVRQRIEASHDDADGRLEPFRQILQRQRKRVAELKQGLTPVDPLDPGDAAGAARQAELRTWLRQMEGQKRRDTLQGAMKRAKGGDEEAIELLGVVASAPAPLSGVAPALHGLVRNTLIQQRHPERLERIEALERNARAIERSLRQAEKTIEAAKGLGR